jgi:hypothetical protein
MKFLISSPYGDSFRMTIHLSCGGWKRGGGNNSIRFLISPLYGGSFGMTILISLGGGKEKAVRGTNRLLFPL